jgi:hypothetical protein
MIKDFKFRLFNDGFKKASYLIGEKWKEVNVLYSILIWEYSYAQGLIVWQTRWEMW